MSQLSSLIDQLQQKLAEAIRISEDIEAQQDAGPINSPGSGYAVVPAPWRIADNLDRSRLQQIFSNTVRNHLYRSNLISVQYGSKGRTIGTAVLSGLLGSMASITDLVLLRRLASIQHPLELTNADLNKITQQPLTVEGWREFVRLLKAFDEID